MAQIMMLNQLIAHGNSLTEIGFRGTQDDINTALATLAFKGDGTTGSPTVTLSVTPAGSLYSANGHYYEVVDHASNITWRCRQKLLRKLQPLMVYRVI